ncbi:hypothetical protein LINGRAHAP2_LOCUS14638 [Linum grandiflorum]
MLQTSEYYGPALTILELTWGFKTKGGRKGHDGDRRWEGNDWWKNKKKKKNKSGKEKKEKRKAKRKLIRFNFLFFYKGHTAYVAQMACGRWMLRKSTYFVWHT